MAAAARRAEIERQLARLQIEREQEATVLAKIRSDDDATHVDAGKVRELSSVANVTSIVVFGSTVKIGDRVKVSEDVSTLRHAEAALPRRDPLTVIYLGEPGEVLTVTESYHGKPAVELKFCDGSRHWYFAECLNVGLRQPKPRPEATAVPQIQAPPTAAPAVEAGQPRHHQRQALDPTAPVALPKALPKRPPKLAPVATSDKAPTAFDEELQLLMELSSNASLGEPITPGPGRAVSPAAAAAGPAVHVDPTARPPPATLGTTRTTPQTSKAAAALSTANGKATATSSALSASTDHAAPALRPKTATGINSKPGPTTSRKVEPALKAEPTAADPPRVATAARRGVTTTTTSALPHATTASAPAAGGLTSSKPLLLKIYENGNYGDMVNDRIPFRNVTVRPTHKSLSSVLTTVTTQLQWNADGRAATVLYDAATGKPVPSLADLRDGMVLVASTGDAFLPPRANSMLFSELAPAAQELHRSTMAKAAAPRARSPKAGGPTVGNRSSAMTRTAVPTSSSSSLKPAAKPAVAGVTSSRTVATAKRAAAPAAAVSSLLDEIRTLEGQLEFV